MIHRFFFFFIAESVTIRTTAYKEKGDLESIVSSTECTVCAYYSKTSEVPGSVQQTIRLPLSLAYEVHQMSSTNFSWSAKISVDESPVALKTLFKGKLYNIIRCSLNSKLTFGKISPILIFPSSM